VVRLQNDKALIYLKTIPAFYSSEHNPLMCWVGSGYEFEQLKEMKVGPATIYTGTLKNNEDVLHTAWWYDNSRNRTISQLDWRWHMLNGGKQYSVVNVTCNTQAELLTEVKQLLNTGVLNNVIVP
jgi:exosortase N